MRHGRAVAKVLVGGACFVFAGSACNPNGCATTDTPTLGDLVFTGEPGNGVIQSENTLPGVPNDAWGNNVLNRLSNPAQDLNLFPLTGPTGAFPYMTVTYQATPPPAQLFRHEVNLFARDPHEYANTIFGFVSNESDWLTNTGACGLPQTVRLLYPNLGGIPATHTPTIYPDFYPNCGTGQLLPQIRGMGYGQIQGALMNDHGLCGASIDASGIFSTLQQVLWTQYKNGVAQKSANVGGCLDAEQQWFYAAEYIDENPNLKPDFVPSGGFDLNVSLDAPVVLGSTPAVQINYSYAWSLSDGILNVVPTAHGDNNNGATGAAAIDSNVASGLQDAVSGGILQAALTKQAADLNAKIADCVPAGGSFLEAPAITQVPIDTGDLNIEINLLKAAIGQAAQDGTFAALGLDDSTTNMAGLHPSQILEAPLTEPDPSNSKVYHNWICALTCPPDFPNCTALLGGGHYRYEFVPRARRLNYYPDSVELIFSDDLPDEVGPLTGGTTTTSGVSLYVVLFDQYLTGYQNGTDFADGGAFSHLSLLCNGSGAGSSRSFTVFSGGHMYNSSSNTASCDISAFEQVINSLDPWNIQNTLDAIGVAIGQFLNNLF